MMQIGRVIPIDDCLEKIAVPAGSLLGRVGSVIGRGLEAIEPVTHAVRGAAIPAMKSVSQLSPGGQAWVGRGVGAGVGAVTGAGVGAAGAEEGNRGGAALRGALLGAGLGFAGGQVGTQAGRAQIGRFGQRQLHSVTNYVPRTAEQIAAKKSRFGIGWTNEEKLEALKRMGFNEKDEAVRAGLTSIPALARGLANSETRKQSLKNIYRSQGLTGLGLTGMLTVPSLYVGVKEKDPEQLFGALGGTVGSVVGAPLPLVGSSVLYDVGDRGGRLIGRGVKKIMGKVTPNTPGDVVPPPA